MSLEPYYFRPVTPPETSPSNVVAGRRQQRNTSGGSLSGTSYLSTCEQSPESVHEPTPSRVSVFRQCGPTLLPKIRTQDNNCLNPSAGQTNNHHRRAVSNASHASTFSNISRPSYSRSSTEPIEGSNLMSPISITNSRSSSVTPMGTMNKGHSRNITSVSIDDGVLSRYGYPTYRQMPIYTHGDQQRPVSQQHTPSPDLFASDYLQYNNMNLIEPPSISIDNAFDLGTGMECYSRPSSSSPPPQQMYPIATSSLLNYLTQPTQPVNLVRQLTFATGRGLSSHFWWDVRNVRPWTSFSLSTIATIPDLLTLLNFQHDLSSLPVPASSQTATVTPASELDLAQLITKIYFPKVNTATQLSLGQNCPSLYLAPAPTNAATTISANSHPTFLANYPTDSANRTLTGLPRGRVVGLVKSFDRWNTGMRHEGPSQKVQYLKGLSHLQKCMRDHSCRYGFIITEIELVCVRMGCDNIGSSGGVPWFGYLEVSEGIPVKTSNPSSTPGSITSDPFQSITSTPFTVSIALYYLLMLAKATPLPGQPGSFMDVGGPGALTRQKVWSGLDLPEDQRGKDGKDKWIPEPQVGEKRDAKTARGWVWPNDPWHKREGGGVGRKARR